MSGFRHPASGVVGNPHGPRLKGVEESLRERQSLGVSEGTLAEAVEDKLRQILREHRVSFSSRLPVYKWQVQRQHDEIVRDLLAALPVLLGELVPREDLNRVSARSSEFRVRAQRAEAALAECRDALEGTDDPRPGGNPCPDCSYPAPNAHYPGCGTFVSWREREAARANLARLEKNRRLSDFPGGGS